MKTYRLEVKGMAQFVSGSTYDTTAETYRTKNRLQDGIYTEFEPLPDALRSLAPADYEIHVYAKNTWQTYALRAYVCKSILSIENGIYPQVNTSLEAARTGALPTGTSWRTLTRYYSHFDSEPFERGAYLYRFLHDSGSGTASDYIEVYTPNSEYKPYALLYYNEGSKVAYADAPGGFLDRGQAQTFSWHTTWVGFPIEAAPQTSAKLQWKNGSSGTVNTIDISSSSTTYTMAANTLPESAELYWRVQLVSSGTTVTSSWKAIRTTDTEGVATAISPNGTYVDASEPVRFTWNYATETGTAQSAYDLQIKTASADWTTIASDSASDTFCDVPTGTLPGGSIQWRVRGYNQTGTAGPWSAALPAVVIAAPDAPEIWATQVSPRPTVAWSAVGQVAYELRFGQHETGVLFGTDKTAKCPVYLADGATQISVRVQNDYGLWSPWSSTTVNVANSDAVSKPRVAALPGMEETQITIAALTTFSSWTTGSRINPTAGSNNTGYPGYMRTGYVTAWTTPLRIRMTDPDYVFCVWTYSAASVSSAVYTPNANYSGTDMILTKTLGANRFRIAVGRADGADLTTDYADETSDAYRILHALETWALTPAAEDGADARLAWCEIPDASGYILYRNGEPFAETTDTTYTDRYSVGDTSYAVRAVFADSDNYRLTDTVICTVSVPAPRITALDGEWIDLGLSTTAIPTTAVATAPDLALMTYAGVEFPVPEFAPHKTRTYTCNPAFRDPGEARAFERLLGAPVFVKDQYGNSMLGVMTSLNRIHSTFYTACTAVIQEIGGVKV